MTTAGLRKHAARDVIVLAATLLLWNLQTSPDASPLGRGFLVALITGALTAICGYLFHEWGHLVAALAVRSKVQFPVSAREVFLFRFDVENNTARQFLVMSCGGFAASALVVAFLAVMLPLETTAGRIALVLVSVGVVATGVLELPPFFRVLRGGTMPTGVAFVGGDSDRDLRRDRETRSGPRDADSAR